MISLPPFWLQVLNSTSYSITVHADELVKDEMLTRFSNLFVFRSVLLL